MANLTHIARPYALAAFDCARDKNQLAAWNAFLASAALVAKNPIVTRMASNPKVQPTTLFDLFRDVLQSILDTELRNFLHILALNRRLLVLPDIAAAFNQLCQQLEKISKVRVITAIPAPASFQQKLMTALSKRIKNAVTLQCEVDPAIIGGAIVHMGDSVIDGSTRGKISRLLEFLLR